MPIEAEVKIPVPCDRLDNIVRAIEDEGFLLIDDSVEEDIYYSHPCRDLLGRDEALRIRRKRDSVTITYKGPKIEHDFMKLREEIESRADPNMAGILEALGFKPSVVVRKRRSIYSKDGLMIMVDRVEGLGCFIEIEADASRKDLVEDIAKKIGVDLARSVRESYAHMMLRHKG